jgi:DNA polymerase-4
MAIVSSRVMPKRVAKDPACARKKYTLHRIWAAILILMRRILHVDMDAFFAAVEQKRRPELAGKPVIVGGAGDPTKRGVVSTASYEARTYGVHSAMPLRTAYRLCPEGVFLPVDVREYSRVSEIVKNVLRQFSPVMEDVGIDEAFLDISDSAQASEEVGRDIKQGIREATGLTCSVGIAPNKLLAKIASDMRKPDGLTIIAESDIAARIWPLPVRKLTGVGPKTEARLKAMGVTTIGELAARPKELLIEQFGNSYGAWLSESARGIDERSLVIHWEPKSLSRETTFEVDVADWQVLARTLVELGNDAVADLTKRGCRSKTVTIKIRFSDFETHTRAHTLDAATDSGDAIRRAAFECMKRIEFRKKVRLIGIRLSGLEKS